METRWARAAGAGVRPASPASGSCGVVPGCVLGIASWPGPAIRRRRDRPGKRSSPIPRWLAIDKGIAEGWETAGVKPAKPATDEEFLRRAYLDLLGRIPNVQEARAFLGTKETDKRGKLVEYLLNHPDFAKNFATQWTVLLIGRGNQGRMVDRAVADDWLRKQFAPIGPGTRSSTSWSRRRARTRKTARSIMSWPTSSSTRFR